MLDFAARVGLEPSDNAWRVQAAMVRFLESDWQRPDEGISEVRGVPRHFTHSKVMAWVAEDRAVRVVRNGRAGPLDRWASLAKAIREEVLREGFDASSLLFSLVGFLPATDPRMVGTVRAIEERLLVDGLVARYRTAERIDGQPPGEGLFITCTFWLADNLALQGRVNAARELFERLLGLRNDVGLLSEQWDPSSRRLTGNFPQAFSHVGLINTAWNLENARSADRSAHLRGLESRSASMAQSTSRSARLFRRVRGGDHDHRQKCEDHRDDVEECLQQHYIPLKRRRRATTLQPSRPSFAPRPARRRHRRELLRRVERRSEARKRWVRRL